jgi:hypothetical protein
VGIHRTSFDLIHRTLDALWCDDDRRTQARFAVQAFVDDPIVHRSRKGRGQILAEKSLDPIKAVHDRDTRSEMIERVSCQAANVGAVPARGRQSGRHEIGAFGG